MNKRQIMEIQERVGAEVDGFWGPESTAKTKAHLIKLMPDPHPFPTSQQVRSGNSMFGRRGVKGGYTPPMKSFKPPFPVWLYGDKNNRVKRITCHAECADAMEAVFADLAEVYPDEAARTRAGINAYYGCYNPRNVRGGNTASMHAWAIAIDLDANRNGLRTHWPTKAHMPLEVMECFAIEGFMAAGAFWSRDAMHMQATTP